MEQPADSGGGPPPHRETSSAATESSAPLTGILTGTTVAVEGAVERVAALISVCLNPLLMSALAVGLVSTGYDAPAAEVWAVVGLSLMFMFAMPAFYLFALLRSGRIDSLSVSDRLKRRWPMIISIVLMVILLPSLLAVAQTTAAPVLSVAGIYLFNTVALLIITVRYRISLHAVGLASFIAVSAVFGTLPSFDGFPGGTALFAVAIVCLPVIAWARIRRREHKSTEVVAGILFGLIVPTFELSFLALIGIL